MKKQNVNLGAGPGYWCTCTFNADTCLGCTVDKLVMRVLGEPGKQFLDTRVQKINLTAAQAAQIKKEQSNGK